ncbi:hypothetical protein BKA69DRAFT_1126426 [Paraphysoderma sedebokerense]|nr:hypothetical protein BKA69DRAFT_1126426 [Paraphysoderma sedebokerense]
MPYARIYCRSNSNHLPHAVYILSNDYANSHTAYTQNKIYVTNRIVNEIAIPENINAVFLSPPFLVNCGLPGPLLTPGIAAIGSAGAAFVEEIQLLGISPAPVRGFTILSFTLLVTQAAKATGSCTGSGQFEVEEGGSVLLSPEKGQFGAAERTHFSIFSASIPQ